MITHNSVYGFRGADIKNILNFRDDFVDAHVVKLEQNYRSTQTILSAANAVVANNRGRMDKALWTEIGEGDPIKVRELSDEHAEARYVAAEIERMVDEGVSREEIAVFYRTNAQSRVLEDMLVRAQIGYQVIGGTKFYERAEIRDAVAYLTFLANPQDAGAFTRVANSPKRGLGQTSLSRVLSHADTMGVPVWDAAAEPESVPGLGTAARKALGRFMSTMVRLRERMRERRRRSATCWTSCCARRATSTRSRPSGRSRRRGGWRTSRSSCGSAREYDAMAEQGSVGEFLQQIALIADVDSLRDDEGLVTLMTLHNAKGLEFPIVFMIGMEDGVFPHSRALDEGGLEEERRLAYVGLTRAMRDLTLTYARRRSAFGGASGPGLRSRFIDEIPRELTDQEDTQGGRRRLGARPGRVVVQRRGGHRRGAARHRGRRLPARRRRRPRRVRRGRGHRHRAGRDRRRALRRRRLGAQADGRLRADPEAALSRPPHRLARRAPPALPRLGDRLPDTVFYAAIVPLLPTYAADFDLSKTGAGCSRPPIRPGRSSAALPGGWLTARIGVRPTVVVGLSTLIASSLAFAFANEHRRARRRPLRPGPRRRRLVGGRGRLADRRVAARAPRRADRLRDGRRDRRRARRPGARRRGRDARARRSCSARVALAGVGCSCGRLLTPDAAARARGPTLRTVLAALREPRIAIGDVAGRARRADVRHARRARAAAARRARRAARATIARHVPGRRGARGGREPVHRAPVGPPRPAAAQPRRPGGGRRDGRAAAVAGGRRGC